MHACQCKDNLIGDGTMGNCKPPPNPCDSETTNDCDKFSICTAKTNALENEDKYECKCKTGFEGSGKKGDCATVKICPAEDIANCDSNAVCKPQISESDTVVYQCECKSGFEGDGKTGNCTVLKTCPAEESAKCDTNAICTPMLESDVVSYQCKCEVGFTGDGTKGNCALIKACPEEESSRCDSNAVCTPTIETGSVIYTCHCNKGFSGNGSVGTCKGNSCSAKRPTNVDGANVLSGKCLKYTCGLCYKGESTQQCCTNGLLTGKFPTCLHADCSVNKPNCTSGPAKISCGGNATYKCDCKHIGSDTVLTCKNGVISGSLPTCKARGCKATVPAYLIGNLNGTLKSNECEFYKCANCYKQTSKGPGLQCCLNGLYGGGSFPTCKHADCIINKTSCVSGPPIITCGNSAVYKCDCGMLGSPTTVACKNGVISGSMPVCKQAVRVVVPCKVTKVSYINGPPTLVSDKCETFSCGNCYVGKSSQRCCNNGTLNGTVPACLHADCSITKPKCISGPATIACGSGATYKCDCGTMGSSTNLTCKNGVISGSIPVCKEVVHLPCKVTKSPVINGPVSLASGKCETFSCANCYVGKSSQRCCNNGTFNGTIPTCHNDDCSVTKPKCISGPTTLACGSSSTYKCDCGTIGYSTNLTCKNGVIAGSMPVCKEAVHKAVLCQVTTVPHVDSPQSLASGRCGLFTCARCYDGRSTQRCCNNGKLNGTAPSCQRDDCHITNPCMIGPATITCGSTTTYGCGCGSVGTSSNITCKGGKTFYGNATLALTSGNALIGGCHQAARCTVGKPYNNSIDGESYIDSGKCEIYTCAHCYRGQATKICCNDGVTDGLLPLCLRNDCNMNNLPHCVSGTPYVLCGDQGYYWCDYAGCSKEGVKYNSSTLTCDNGVMKGEFPGGCNPTNHR